MKKEELRLVPPSLDYHDAFLAAMDEFADAGVDEGFWKTSDSRATLQPYLQRMADWSQGRDVPSTFVPSTMLWLVEGDEFIGRCHIRHKLNDKLLRRGGHIGYYIRPSKWRQGYGTKTLELGMVEAKNLGIRTLLVTTNDTNEASWRIAEKCGGTLENKVTDEDENLIRRYWIDL